MNRIILIGNGFDLAHGMPTSYQDFLNDYLDNKEPIVYLPPTEDDLILPFPIYSSNTFLDHILNKYGVENWVDVESEYYKLLINAIGADTSELINNLNEGFDEVKSLLKEYLQRCDDEFQFRNPRTVQTLPEIIKKFYSEIQIKELSRKAINFMVDRIYDYWVSPNLIDGDDTNKKSVSRSIAEHLRKKNNVHPDISLVRRFISRGSGKLEFEQKPDNITFLNFNYTSTAKSYAHLDSRIKLENDIDSSIDVRTIHIHGSLNEYDSNPIIFGYGDELDDDYKRIEKLNKNEYLENIKSIKYLETDNYKKLLEFIESDEYQVFIFGHSCGTSDRTLLNTLFEHDNCASIKPFYHKYKSKEDPEVYLDNYSDIVRNISRNFNDKIKMRDRVVNKTYCSPLID